MFSNRAKTLQGTTNALYLERDRLLADGRFLVDLISANVTAQGIVYPQSLLKKLLAKAMDEVKGYRPDPRGQRVAREALQAFYLKSGLSIPPEQFILTPGTSLAYAYAFNLFSDRGGEILCPRPSYPLFDTLAMMCDVALKYYHLRPQARDDAVNPARWEIDFEHMASLISPKTRAIVLVSPHNPTGAVASEPEIKTLGDLAASYRLPIISDEVFSPFVYSGKGLARAAQSAAPLVLTLNGISKMFALPGYKLGWMALTGEAALVKRALASLETFSDAFLPVQEGIQFALPQLFKEGAVFLEKYRSKMKKRRQAAIDTLSRIPRLSFIPPEGGFYFALKLEDPEWDDEACALDLLRSEGLLVHPGYLYDFDASHLVMSFTSKPAALRKHLQKMGNYFLMVS